MIAVVEGWLQAFVALTALASGVLMTGFSPAIDKAPLDNSRSLPGVWVDAPYVAERNCYGLLLLFPDQRFAMSECSEDFRRCVKTERIGAWTFKGNVLRLAVAKQARFAGKWQDFETGEGCVYGEKPAVRIFAPPVIILLSCELPSAAPDPAAEPGTHCWEMTLNGKRYWKFNAGFAEFCKLISLAAEWGSAGKSR